MTYTITTSQAPSGLGPGRTAHRTRVDCSPSLANCKRCKPIHHEMNSRATGWLCYYYVGDLRCNISRRSGCSNSYSGCGDCRRNKDDRPCIHTAAGKLTRAAWQTAVSVHGCPGNVSYGNAFCTSK